METARFNAPRQSLWRRLLGADTYERSLQPALEEVAEFVRSEAWQGITVAYHPKVTQTLLRTSLEGWLQQAHSPTAIEGSGSHPLHSVDHSYIPPLSYVPHLRSLYLNVVDDMTANESSLISQTPFIHLYSLVPSLTSLSLRGCFEPDLEEGRSYVELDIQLILSSLCCLRHLTLVFLPVHQQSYLPLVLDSTHHLDRLHIHPQLPSMEERQVIDFDWPSIGTHARAARSSGTSTSL